MALAHSPRIVTDGLALCLDAANIKSYKNYNLATYSQDFTNAVWAKSTGLVSATGLLAPDGSLTATTLTDDVNGAYENWSRSFTIPNDSSSYNISIYIKKTTGGTSTRTGFNVSLLGGTVKNYNIRFNADTGVAVNGDTNLVTSENNDFWRLSFTVTNNSTGNVTLNLAYYPATGFYNLGDDSTATGSHTVWGMQITRGAALLPYRINVNDLSEIWTDLTGNECNGTLTNSALFNLDGGGSIAFDGTDDYVTMTSANIPDIIENGNVTQEAWVYLNSLSTFSAIFVKGRTGLAFNYGLVIGTNGTLYFRNSNSDYAVSAASKVTTGAWFHLAITTNASGSVGYINGEQQLTNASALTKTSAVKEVSIGRRSILGGNASTEYMNGDIALVKVYNRTLTAAEIQQNFNALRGRFGI